MLCPTASPPPTYQICNSPAEPSHLLLSLAWHAFAAKTRTAPDIYSWQQMRGREWDEPKTVEVRTLERLGAYTKVAADDDRIKGRRQQGLIKYLI